MNWITLIGGVLLVIPLLNGCFRSSSNQLEQMKYSLYSVFSSIQWMISYVAAIWVIQNIVLAYHWQIPQIQWIQQQLQANMAAWVVALPITAIFISWLLGYLVEPIVYLLNAVLHQLQRSAHRLPQGASRILDVILQIPRALLHTFIFFTAVHLLLPYMNAPALTQMARTSGLYQWADIRVIDPMLESNAAKHLPVLGKQASNWFHSISVEAAKNGPADTVGFWTWQTRFDSNPEIDAKASQIVQGSKNDREKAYRLYQWIGSHIQYDDKKAQEVESGQFQMLRFGAVPTFETEKGICSDYSSLMVAMGRAVGLKVEQEVGEGRLSDGSGGPHAWNVVFLKDENKTVPCDPTWEHAGNFFDSPDFYVWHRPENRYE